MIGCACITYPQYCDVDKKILNDWQYASISMLKSKNICRNVSIIFYSVSMLTAKMCL